MRPLYDGWTIVLVGGWNMSLLTPQWVARNLFDTAQVAVQVLVAPGKQPTMRYRHANVLFAPSTERVMLTMLNDEAPTLEYAERVASTLLTELPHTPITGVGVNFRFAEDATVADLAAIFDFGDNGRLGDAGWAISRPAITRRLSLNGVTLNLSMSSTENEITFDLNFHTDVVSGTEGDATAAATAAAALRGTVLDRRERSLALLTEAYELQPLGAEQ